MTCSRREQVQEAANTVASLVLPKNKGHMKVVSLGFDNGIVAARIVAVADASSSAMKRLRDEARKAQRLVDVTNGRRTRAIVVADSGHIFLCSIQPQTLTQRIEEAK
ncbi:extracellular matrix/biofilm biosynthesis regulator RemA family protein [Candidatus Omnitrophota bacterium]